MSSQFLRECRVAPRSLAFVRFLSKRAERIFDAGDGKASGVVDYGLELIDWQTAPALHIDGLTTG